MKRLISFPKILMAILPLFLFACQQVTSTTNWQKHFPEIGSSASPACTDLNLDGVLDIVLGAGKNEFEKTDLGVLAIDGRNGELLWSYPVRDQLVGTPVFLDITNDSIPEVFIGGRSAQFFAINGRDGSLIWEYDPIAYENDSLLRYMRFNFYSAQLIPDQNQDGSQDLLVSNGGNVLAHAKSEKGRYPGYLAILDSKNGDILAADTMPDGKETYMSPVAKDMEGKGAYSVVFGTGGETIGGSLYVAPLRAITSQTLSQATILISQEEKGFIAPPLLADLNEDGVADIIANWHGGTTYAFDGLSHKRLWKREIPNTETYASLTPGHVNDDGIPDLFTTFNHGTWPRNTGSVQVLLDGKTGEILYKDSLGCAGYASAISFDTNADNYDEFLFPVNNYNCDGIFLGEVRYDLLVFDYQQQAYQYVIQDLFAKNVSSTAWVGDLDEDGYFDLIYCTQANTTKIYTYFGLMVNRIATNIPIGTRPFHGKYLENS